MKERDKDKFLITCKKCGFETSEISSYDHSFKSGYGIVVIYCPNCANKDEFIGA